MKEWDFLSHDLCSCCGIDWQNQLCHTHTEVFHKFIRTCFSTIFSKCFLLCSNFTTNYKFISPQTKYKTRLWLVCTHHRKKSADGNWFLYDTARNKERLLLKRLFIEDILRGKENKFIIFLRILITWATLTVNEKCYLALLLCNAMVFKDM